MDFQSIVYWVWKLNKDEPGIMKIYKTISGIILEHEGSFFVAGLKTLAQAMHFSARL